MIPHRLFGASLAAVLVTAPCVADEKVTPSYLTLPGTDTRLKIYGIAYLNSWYYLNQDLTDTGALIGGKTDALNANLSPDGQLGVTARYSRVGFTTVTPSAWLGDITTLVEFDFTKEASRNGGLNLRHAYAAFGNWTLGLTWSNWLDTDATGETVDMNGPVGQACNGTSRYTQVRYRYPVTKRSSLAFSVEQNRMGWGKFTDDVATLPVETATIPDSRYPTFTGAYTFTDDWGHVSLRALEQNLGAFTPQANANPEYRSSAWGGGLQLTGVVKLGKDKLVGSVYTGRGLGDYGPDIQGATYDSTNHRLFLYRNCGWQAGYTHAWTQRVRSNLVVSGVTFADDAAVTNKSIKNAMNYFANTFVKLSRSVELGMEYGYENLHTFAPNAVVTRGGTLSDFNRSNKFQVSLAATF